ncbi:MAG: LPP20 family lipoprotein, partial [Candidatus Cloacimonetes bacterium]|nr:LPP20 family lipoprotein [Candidatus Cloacimonadota bacterium]
MKRFVITLMMIMLLACVANAKSKKRPDWVDNPQNLYPDNIYMAAVGEGSSRKKAKTDAYSALAQRFEAKVSVNKQTIERYEELTKNNETKTTAQTTDLSDITIQTDQNITNIQFGEFYVEEGRTYVIAFLERLKTAEILIEKININAKKVTYYLNETRS